MAFVTRITSFAVALSVVELIVFLAAITAAAKETDPTLQRNGHHGVMDPADDGGPRGCSGTMQSLLPCLDAVEGDSLLPPSTECCDAVLRLNTDCFCNVLDESEGLFPGVNVDAALQLPRECGRFVPKGFECGGYLVPSSPSP